MLVRLPTVIPPEPLTLLVAQVVQPEQVATVEQVVLMQKEVSV